MKKAILTLAVVALVASTAMSNTDPSASEAKSKLSLNPVDETTFELEMATASKGSIRLKISDQKGNLITSEKVFYSKSFNLPIDMSYLTEGTYVIKAESPDASLEQEVFVSQLHQEDVAAFLKDQGEGKYDLTVYHEKVPVSIKITDLNGTVYFDDTIDSDRNFSQRYDLSQIKGTKLTMTISGEKSRIIKAI